MIRVFVTLLVCVCPSLGAVADVGQRSRSAVVPWLLSAEHSAPYRSDQVLVKLRSLDHFAEPGSEYMRVAALLQVALPGSSVLHGVNRIGWYVVALPSDVTVEHAVKTLMSHSSVARAEPNYTFRILVPDPNDESWKRACDDPDFGADQAPFSYTWDQELVNALAGWSLWPNQFYTAANKPRNAVKLAVLDSGIDQTHREWRNAGSESVDARNGGQLDVVDSGGFFGGTKGAGPWGDFNGHGTHVSGTAAASGNTGSPYADGHGVIGTGYNAQILTGCITDAEGNGVFSDLADAIVWSSLRGAMVINMSVGEENPSYILQEALDFAWANGAALIAAANEDGAGGGDLGPIYPAASSKVLGVTACVGEGQLSSNYAGSGYYVGLIAPGGDVVVDFVNLIFYSQYVWSTSPDYHVTLNDLIQAVPPISPGFDQRYAWAVGTSMAAPHAAGAAALFVGAKALRPSTPYGNLRTFQAIQRGAVGYVGITDWDSRIGYGLLDVEGMLFDTNVRGATKGGVTGLVYVNGTFQSNARVSATRVGGGSAPEVVGKVDGSFQLRGLTPGTWAVRATGQGYNKTKHVAVLAGCDTPGVDFWLGSNQSDNTPAEAIVWDDGASTASTTQLRARWFAADAQSGIDKYEYSVGTSPGSTNTKGWTDAQGAVDLTFNATMVNGATYFINLRVTNGAGLTSVVSSDGIRCGTVTSRTVSGTIALEQYFTGSAERAFATAFIRQAGTMNVLESHPLYLGEDGAYSFSTSQTGIVDIAVGRYRSWLGRVARNVNLASSVSNLNFILPAGDVTRDDIIDDADITNIILDFGFSGSGLSDATGEGAVDDADLTLAVLNFGMASE